MHGELLKVRCIQCATIYEVRTDVFPDHNCESCHQQNGLRPHIVWFGEVPHFLDEIEEAMDEADMFVSIGTSGNVYPAAGLVDHARQLNIPAIELNLEPSQNASLFTQGLYGPATQIVPEWISSIIEAV